MYVADFETTTTADDCRVWAFATCNINDTNDIDYGNNIDDFFKWCETKGRNETVYFHNLKFDGSFIIDWLLHNKFEHVNTPKERRDKTFTTMISDGLFYQIEVVFRKVGQRVYRTVFRDSLKILPMSVDKMAKAFNLDISKLDLDYKAYREIGHELTDDEIKYITNDVVIVARAIKFMMDRGMNKMTTASNAFNEYKSLLGKNEFKHRFPPPIYDADIRQSYRGGFTYLNPKYACKEVKDGIVFDVNSLYPSVMYYEKLPYGDGLLFEGEYKQDDIYDVYIQMFTCSFELKPGHIPTLQLKRNLRFVPTEYITSSNDEDVTMCLTSVDLKLFFDHYDVYNPVYHKGWKFRSTTGLFRDYIDKWSGEKIKAKIEGNGGMYTLSKLMLNSLYGKFGSKTKIINQVPVLGDDDIVRFQPRKDEEGNIVFSEKKPIYIPVAAFITAYARNKTIRSAQKVYDRFIYADTDSLHLEGTEIPKELDVDDTRLGAWKHESTFTRAKFIRAKTYIEDENPAEVWNTEDYDRKKFKITCAGMPESCYPQVTYDNFVPNAEYTGKLQTSHVKGGAILKETTFRIKA